MIVCFRSPAIVTEGSELKCSDVFLKEKEAHKFIKEVVKAGKVIKTIVISSPGLIPLNIQTAVFNHLLASHLQLHLGDLAYLGCQHGHLDMVRSMLDTKVEKDTSYVHCTVFPHKKGGL